MDDRNQLWLGDTQFQNELTGMFHDMWEEAQYDQA
jgi:hypothetical protein